MHLIMWRKLESGLQFYSFARDSETFPTKSVSEWIQYAVGWADVDELVMLKKPVMPIGNTLLYCRILGWKLTERLELDGKEIFILTQGC